MYVCCVVLFVFRDRVSQCSIGCPRTCSVNQSGLRFGDLPDSAGIKGVHQHYLDPNLSLKGPLSVSLTQLLVSKVGYVFSEFVRQS